MDNTKSPEILLIGHLALDEDVFGLHVGGSVFFASKLLEILKFGANIVTSYNSKTVDPIWGRDFNVKIVESSSTTTFNNYYNDGKREQLVSSIATPITKGDIPTDWLSPDVVLATPLIGELEPDVLSVFESEFVVANLQGWLRQLDKKGFVKKKIIDIDELLAYVNIAVVSQEDIEDKGVLVRWANFVDILVVTMGVGGCKICVNNKWHYIPGIKAVDVDSVGAGDVFLAAYIVKYFESCDFLQAADFANRIAGISIEGKRTSKLVDSILLDMNHRN
jgi:sugar/nucleoside kinase (ribokinase family)